MSQAEGNHSQRLRLVNHLKLIEDLWQKLYYVKWNPKSFTMLARLAQDMARNAQDRGDERLRNLVAQLEQHVKNCAVSGGVPSEPDRQRLTALIEAVRNTLTAGGGHGVDDEPRTRPLLSPLPEIILITPDENSPLVAKLEGASYRIRYFTNLIEAEQRLRERVPGAIIVDVDFPSGPESAITLIARLRAETGLRVPVLFLAERNDINARLEAVRAGSMAYFSKPFDTDEVLEVLRELLLPQTSQGYFRVLIVNDQPAEAWEIAGALEEQGITPRVVIQPLQVLQDIYRFRPDLLLIDLDIKEVSGPELVQAIAQHRDCGTLPVILLCFPDDALNHMLNLDASGASLLTKPVPTGYLCWEVKQRLRRARALRVKLNLLTDNDPVSGLANRQRYLLLLERAMETLGLDTQSLAVMFIVLDNLRPIRDSAGVATADEVVGQAANRLRQVLSPDQPAARFSDAIFTVMVSNLTDEPLLALARRIRDALETGFYKIGEQALLLRTSVGLALATDRGQEDHLTLLQRADSACALAREAKKERIVLQQQSSAGNKRNQEASSRARMLEQVREIVEHERLWLVFQPIASMRGDTSERYEVLLRLRGNDGQELVPGSVFGVVYNHELGQALDRWVIEHVLDMLRQRQRKTTVFIKVLPVTLQDRTLNGWLRERLEQTGVEAQYLVFEVAEATAERNLRDMFGFLGSIKMLGCGFCLDRFGRGTDSLSLLKNLGADYVKLDMYFVNGIARDSKKQMQIKELVQNLEILGAATIVGGVEDVKAMPILWSLGVDLIQGFFLQHPYREMSYDFAGSAF